MTDYRRLYDRMAPFYAPAMRLLPVWRHYIDTVHAWLPGGGAVLEIGPGPGYLLGQLQDRYDQVVGCDLSAGMIRRARSHTGEEVAFVQGDAVALPLASDRFTAVTLTFVFSAIPDGLMAMREFYRILQPGGLLVLVDAGVPDDGNAAGRLLARCWELFGDFMRDEAALMRAAGFDVVHRHAYGAFQSIRLVVGRRPLQG